MYNYINTLKNNDKKFFNSLHGYKIYDNCKHVQIRSKIDPVKNKELFLQTKKLDESKWCVCMLTDYLGNCTLGKYIATNNLNYEETYSFIFQMIKIITILYNGGYSHNDLHMINILLSIIKKFHIMVIN